MGLQHLPFALIHLLLAASLVLLFPTRKAIHGLVAYTAGQTLSMLAADLGLPGIPLIFTDILVTLVILLLALSAFYHFSFRGLVPVSFTAAAETAESLDLIKTVRLHHRITLHCPSLQPVYGSCPGSRTIPGGE